MLKKSELLEICYQYGFDFSNFMAFKQIKIGHINRSYILSFNLKSTIKRYFLQEINTYVFKRPQQLMKNIEKITDFLNEKMESLNLPNKENLALKIIKTKKNKTYMISSTHRYYRIYNYIENAKTYQKSNNAKIIYNAGQAIGNFQNLLAEFDASLLSETIKDFHNTPKRYRFFLKTLKEDKYQRKAMCMQEINFALKMKKYTNIIMSLLKDQSIPIKVTHNDTKLNNIMFDIQTHQSLCVVDLDTVMPGSILFDYGDAIRSSCNTKNEDEKDTSLVHFSKPTFVAFSKGYLSSVKNSITQTEIDHLIDSIIVMTFECGLRFLTDYLEGDVYFKIHYENHNLIRCRTQFKLVQEILEQKDDLEKSIQKIVQHLK